MDLADIPLFAMIRGKLGYLSERQKVIAENVANANTPGYKPHELKPFSFQAQVQAQATSASSMAVTQPGHMTPPHASGSASVAKPVVTKDSETTLDGNSVVLEDEMLKMSQARADYDAAIGFYQKSLDLIRLAARAPGHG
ncbi:flagellar basal body rod protein FlgB [Phenylobacterium sp.]|uniref:flagellar basal body rod protein FlgB n=1 Tax=Phenylobacterium sp. TaxID=1871053 RepID=UPI002DEDEC4C|nr:flagellar basal body rod protein FlgB [Phenylobacterium sp.]